MSVIAANNAINSDRKKRPNASVRIMRKTKTIQEGDLRPEYDLKRLRVRRLGRGRVRFSEVVRLEPDVAQGFPDAASVNEALRFLIRITKERKNAIPKSEGLA